MLVSSLLCCCVIALGVGGSTPSKGGSASPGKSSPAGGGKSVSKDAVKGMSGFDSILGGGG